MKKDGKPESWQTVPAGFHLTRSTHTVAFAFSSQTFFEHLKKFIFFQLTTKIIRTLCSSLFVKRIFDLIGNAFSNFEIVLMKVTSVSFGLSPDGRKMSFFGRRLDYATFPLTNHEHFQRLKWSLNLSISKITTKHFA